MTNGTNRQSLHGDAIVQESHPLSLSTPYLYGASNGFCYLEQTLIVTPNGLEVNSGSFVLAIQAILKRIGRLGAASDSNGAI